MKRIYWCIIIGSMIFVGQNPLGTSKDWIIKNEPDYESGHAWCRDDPDKLCVEPKISDWDYAQYCGFTFYFVNGELHLIQSNSPCH